MIRTRGANETIQLASYSNSTRSKLDSSELDSSELDSSELDSSELDSRARLELELDSNVNESSRATRNSTRKAREKLENILYIKF